MRESNEHYAKNHRRHAAEKEIVESANTTSYDVACHLSPENKFVVRKPVNEVVASYPTQTVSQILLALPDGPLKRSVRLEWEGDALSVDGRKRSGGICVSTNSRSGKDEKLVEPLSEISVVTPKE
jgi:hypothetical protein